MPEADKDYAISQMLGEAQIAPGPAHREMPKYACHKQVWALKIKEVHIRDIGTEATYYSLHFVDEGYAPLRVSADYVHKHNPRSGGYYVVYKDGYASFSPAAAFEEGYTRC